MLFAIELERIKFYLNSTPHVISTLSTIIILCFVLLFWDYCSSQKVNQENVIGYIIYKKREVKKKADSGVSWMDAEEQQPLIRRDTIRAEDHSEAIIKLNDGTEIRLEPNSMVILDYIETEAKVNLIQGAIKVNRERIKEIKPLEISSGSKTLTLVEEGDVTLKENNKELSVNVSRGDATLIQDGKEYKIEKDQQLKIEENKVPVVQSIPIVLINPDDQKSFFTDTDNYKINFKWSHKKEPGRIRIEFSKESNFSKLFDHNYINNTDYSKEFPPGIYYWRVIDEKDKDSTSVERKFSIIKNEGFILYKPEPDAKYGFQEFPARVFFNWNENELVSKYIIEFSKSSDFSSIFEKSEIRVASYQQEFKAPGKYFYRIKLNYSNPDIKQKMSETFKMELEQKKQISAPHLTNPKDGDSIKLLKGTEESVVFYWRGEKEINRYLFEISNEESFTNSILRKSINSDTFNYNSFESDKEYFWRVKGILDNGSSTEFSRTGRFNVKIEDPNYIELIDPPDDSIPEIKETGVDFRWKGYSRAPEYLLEISSKEDMSKIMKKNYTKFSSYSERNFGSGKFFWRITLISREGKEISKSKIFSFKIPESEPLEPDFKPRIKDHPDTFYVDK